MTKEQKYQIIWYACDYEWPRGEYPHFESDGMDAQLLGISVDSDEVWVEYKIGSKRCVSSLYCYDTRGRKRLNAQLINIA